MEFHIRITSDQHLPIIFWENQMSEQLKKSPLKVQFDESSNDWGDDFKGINSFVATRALLTVELTSRYYSENINSKSQLDNSSFIESLLSSTIILTETFKKHNLDLHKYLDSLKLSFVSVYYLNKSVTLNFVYNYLENKKTLLTAWIKMLTIIKGTEQNNKRTLSILKSIQYPKNRFKCFSYDLNLKKWILLDQLLANVNKLSSEYRLYAKDARIRKPYIIFNEENYNEYIYFDRQWALNLHTVKIIMTQPNDISLYVNLADKNLNKAKEFYDKELSSRSNKLHLPLLRTELTVQYYDYFEAIISAITFSYTSLETFANICILPEYKYKTEKDGVRTIYSKQGIERKFPLRDKFKVILKDILKTDDPSKEKWWNTFIKLEDIGMKLFIPSRALLKKDILTFFRKTSLKLLK